MMSNATTSRTTTLLLLIFSQILAGTSCWHFPSAAFLTAKIGGREQVVLRGCNHRHTTLMATPFASDSSAITSNCDDDDDVDASLHRTLQQLGVRGIASSSKEQEGVVVQTTRRSVAGRGAFYSSPQHGTDDAIIQQGDVLAYIPKTALLTLSNPNHPLSCSGNEEETSSILDELSSLSTRSSWPVSFTLYVGIVASRNKQFREWIESFAGPDPACPPSDDEAVKCTVQNLMDMTQVSQEIATEAVAARYDAYSRDWRMAKEWMDEMNKHDDNIIGIMDEFQFAKLYSILVSRTAKLGPYYNNTRGVIPLHDMINHPPLDIEHNVELFTVGDLRELVPEEERVQHLVGRVFQHSDDDDVNEGNNKDGAALSLDDRDVLLVARREISPGEELFLSYRNNRARPMVDEKERAWTTLQYGFFVQ